MLVVKKFIAAFLLPPGGVILLLLALAFWESRRKRRLTGILTAACALLLWALSLSPVADRLTIGLEREFSLPARATGDVIILLGGGVIEGVPDISGTGVPSSEMLGRVVTAVRLQKKLHVPIIVSGGAPPDFRIPEAPIVRRFLVDLGVPADRVILEEKSRDTMENAAYTAKICAARGFRHPILVTSAFHLRRAVVAFRRNGMNVAPFPAYFHAWEGKRYGLVHFLPNAGALAESSTALREYIGLLFYKLSA